MWSSHKKKRFTHYPNNTKDLVGRGGEGGEGGSEETVLSFYHQMVTCLLQRQI